MRYHSLATPRRASRTLRPCRSRRSRCQPWRTLGPALPAALVLGALAMLLGCATQVSPPNPDEMYRYTFRPEGEGPFPGIVLLHGCAGWGGREIAWAKQFKEWGYVALVVSSFKARGIEDKCGSENIGPGSYDERVEDAYGGLIRLQSMPEVDPGRVAVIGWSHGGGTTLRVAQERWRSRYVLTETQRFAAAVAYYPWCDKRWGTFNTPLLIEIGEADMLNPAGQCRTIATVGTTPAGPPQINIYPGAYHAFDFRDATGGPGPHKREYHPQAAAASRARVKAFLDKHL